MLWKPVHNGGQVTSYSQALSDPPAKLWKFPIFSHTQLPHCENAQWASPQIHSTTTTTKLS